MTLILEQFKERSMSLIVHLSFYLFIYLDLTPFFPTTAEFFLHQSDEINTLKYLPRFR